MKSNRLQLHTPPSFATINWEKYKTKKYLHFDNPLSIKRIKHLIQNPQWISTHAFLPFIKFDMVFTKYTSNKIAELTKINQIQKTSKKKHSKIRTIMYASHKDQFIYKYYGDILNNYYNQYAWANNIDSSVLAYRNNKKGKSNIHFSAEVFRFLKKQDEAIILSLDFSQFFDKIVHKKLKNNIRIILDTNEIPLDIYNVFKNNTKYSYVNREKIEDFLIEKYGKEKTNELRKKHQLKRIMSDKEFRDFKKDNLYKNKKPYGIPQGSGLSAVCSNIHLIQFDKEMVRWAKDHRALYRRYSDDFIIIIPTKTHSDKIEFIENEVIDIVDKYAKYGLKIKREKTEVRALKNKQIYDKNGKKSTLDYLGFVMDGNNVQIREKSLFKYYSRAYRKAKVCKNILEKVGKKYEWRKLYKVYTHLGINYKGHGNFISYAKKADKLMQEAGLNSKINNQIKRHWNKIQKRLKD